MSESTSAKKATSNPPQKNTGAAAKKTAAKKSASSAAKKTPAKTSTSAAAKKTAAKKSTPGSAKKTAGTAPKKTTAKKPAGAAAKTAAKKSTPSAAKKTAGGAAKKTAAKKTPATKSTTSAAKTSAPARKRRMRNLGRKTDDQPGKTADSTKMDNRSATVPFSKYFKRSQSKAAKALRDPEEIRRIAEEAAASGAERTSHFAEVMEDFKALIRLVVAYSRGHYREIPVDQLLLILAGLIYVASPIDLVPDMLPGGFVDDAVAIGWVLKAVQGELHAFREWELGKD